MKFTVSVLAAACLSVAQGADAPSSKPPVGFAKNLARQHYATNLLLFDTHSQRYVATEAAAAWLDDDVATGWPALAGKQDYLLQLSEPQLLTGFALSTLPTTGTISLYTSDQAAAPGDKAWTLAAKNLSIESLNDKKLAKAINKTTKYLLIETNIADPKAIYSLYVYGQKSASADGIVQRSQPVDVRSVYGEFVNNQTAFNLASLYAKAQVSYANSGTPNLSWQRAIDDNPESSTTIKPTTNESGMIVKFDGTHPISRLSVLAAAGTKGQVDVFLLSQAPQGAGPVSIEGIQPSLSLTFDGNSSRPAADFAETNATALAIRWTPATGDAALTVKEINAFADLSLADYEVGGAGTTVAENAVTDKTATDKAATDDNSASKDTAQTDDKSPSDGKTTADGKAMAPIGEGKESIDPKGGPGKEPIGLGPTGRGFDPGPLGYPPRTPPILIRPPTPNQAVSN